MKLSNLSLLHQEVVKASYTSLKNSRESMLLIYGSVLILVLWDILSCRRLEAQKADRLWVDELMYVQIRTCSTHERSVWIGT